MSLGAYLRSPPERESDESHKHLLSLPSKFLCSETWPFLIGCSFSYTVCWRFISLSRRPCRQNLFLHYYYCLASSPAWAVAPVMGGAAELANLQAAIKASQSAGDNAWMLVSAALVLMMTGPGLALFYCGLVRKKNVLGTMMQSFAMMALITLLWAVCGYSLVFAPGNPFIGDLRYAFLHGVGRRPEPAVRAHHPASDVHDLSAHVRHHHAGADRRRFRRAHALRRHADLLHALGCSWSTSRWRTWSGAMAAC